jgi:hypothetical protein
MSEQLRNLPHLSLPNHPDFTKRENYTYPGPSGGGGKSAPSRDRDAHAIQLRADLGSVFSALERERREVDQNLVVGESEFYLDVKFAAAEKEYVLQSLEDLRSTAKVELMAVTPASGNEGYLEATLFVPDSKKNVFERKIDDYQNKDVVDKRTVDRLGDEVEDHPSDELEVRKPKNEALVTRIETFLLGSVTSLFTDEISLFPPDPGVVVWWEVWLRKNRRESFDTIAEKLNLRVQPHSVKFIEREVVVVLASVVQLGQIILHCDAMAELRLAKDLPSFFFKNNDLEQQSWMSAPIQI